MIGDLLTNSPAAADGGRRSLPVAAYLAIVVVYLVIVQGVAALATSGMDIEYGKFPDTETVLRSLWVGVGASLVFVILVITVLRWWRPVLHDDRPVARWVWIVPAFLFGTILVGTNYAALADKGAAFTVTFLIGALMVGCAEEGMFRGIGVVAFRDAGLSEGKVALWTCVIFGAAHGTNIFVEGPSAIMQVLITAIAGFFFYLVRRVSGGIALAVVAHGLWDFALFTGTLEEDPYAGVGLFMLTDVVLAVILLVRRHHIGIDAPPTVAEMPSTT
jgi:membrane protease YdiL (CAAX protease family)